MRLTDPLIKALKAPEKGEIIYADDALTGIGSAPVKAEPKLRAHTRHSPPA